MDVLLDTAFKTEDKTDVQNILVRDLVLSKILPARFEK